MFIFKLTSWLDRYDPYWYGRLLGLKTAYLTVLVFIANLLLHPPVASLIMLLAGAGGIIIEMPTINDLNKKDNLYFGYLLIISVTIAIFSSYVYLKGWFVVATSAWCWLLYTVLRKNPALFPIVSVILMLGLMSLEAPPTGNYYILLNELAFIWQFGLIIFWGHKLFPKRYHFIWLSALLRSIETAQARLAGDLSSLQQVAIGHNLAAKRTLPLLQGQPYLRQTARLTQAIERYLWWQGAYVAQITPAMKTGYLADLQTIQQTISTGRPLAQPPQAVAVALQAAQPNEAVGSNEHIQFCQHFFRHWNQLCLHVNS